MRCPAMLILRLLFFGLSVISIILETWLARREVKFQRSRFRSRQSACKREKLFHSFFNATMTRNNKHIEFDD